MFPFHVKYFYSASGMEGRADRKDYGIIWADSADEAKNKVIEQSYAGEDSYTKSWIKGCLSAKTLISLG